MKLIRYNTQPLYNTHLHPNLLDEMDRLFDVALPALATFQRNKGPGNIQFPIDLYEGLDAFTIRAELPGFRKDDIGLELADGTLTVAAHQETAPNAEAKEGTSAPERRFSRVISLPENVDAEKISAAYENGVLTVTVPKRAEVKPRQIAVEIK